MHTGEIISICLSVGTALVTIYFWLVRSNRERPNLKTHLVAPFDTILTGADRAYRLRNFEKWPYKGTPWHQPDHNSYFFYILGKAVIANLSLEPNTVTGIRASIKSREGNWLPLHTAFFACAPDVAPPAEFERQAQFNDSARLPDVIPFNVPPQNGTFVRLACWLSFPEGESWFEKKRLETDEFYTHLRQFVMAGLAQPLELKVEVSALGGKGFTDVLTAPAADALLPRLRLGAPPAPALPKLPDVPAGAAAEVLAMVKDFVQSSGEPDGSFRPRLARGSRGDYDCTDSPIAAVAYAAVLARTFGWSLPYASQTKEWLLSRQHPDGMFGAAPYSPTATRVATSLAEGSRVQVRWKGGESIYPAKITQREGDRIHVQYDDGDTEWTTIDMASAEGDDGVETLSGQAKVFNSILGLVSLNALNIEPKYDPLPFFRSVLTGSIDELPEYYVSYFPLAFLLRGQAFPEDADRKLRAVIAAKMFSNPYLQDSHLEGLCQVAHYNRLLGKETPEATRIVNHIQQSFRPDEDNRGGWWNNSRSRARAMFSGVFLLRHLGQRDANAERTIKEVVGMLLADRTKKVRGESVFWEVPDPSADAVYYCTAALVMAGVLRPAEPLPPKPHLLGWGHLM